MRVSAKVPVGEYDPWLRFLRLNNDNVRPESRSRAEDIGFFAYLRCAAGPICIGHCCTIRPSRPCRKFMWPIARIVGCRTSSPLGLSDSARKSRHTVLGRANRCPIAKPGTWEHFPDRRHKPVASCKTCHHRCSLLVDECR